MQVTFDQIQEFIPSQESFTIYVKRIKLFFITNEVAANTYIGAFLHSIIVKRNYSLLRNLMSPIALSDKDIVEVQVFPTNIFSIRRDFSFTSVTKRMVKA